LEHPPIFTIGRKGGEGNLLVSKEKLKQLGIKLFYTNRGGDITYHGPGQIVVYPILNLNSYGKDVHRYVYNLEEAIIRVLAEYSISAGRKEKYTGVWVKNKKIAAYRCGYEKMGYLAWRCV
jgi:lipoate-protein ligase B